MLDIRFVREHPDEVKENIKKKFQDAKLPLVDEVINLDAEYRAAIGEGDTLRANRNKLSKQIGMLMGQAKKDPSKAAGQDPRHHVHHPADDRPQRAHRPGRQLQCGSTALWRSCCAGLSHPVPC